LRGFNGANTKRSMTSAQYRRMAEMHGTAGVGSAGQTSHSCAQSYAAVIGAMGSGGVGGFGTDTNGLAKGMLARPGSAVHYDASFPKSRLGDKDGTTTATAKDEGLTAFFRATGMIGVWTGIEGQFILGGEKMEDS
jgi:hypothetical protein